MKKFIRFCAVLIIALSLQGCALVPKQTPYRNAVSFDNVPIAYAVYGEANNKPLLVFVHGWSCDSRYWYYQVPYFSKNYQVVTIDLAGHGHSGQARQSYTLLSFAEDIKAVVDQLDAKRVILIGHSMGGPVSANAAGLMPNRVIGIIGIDTIQNVEYPLTDEEYNEMFNPFKEDFPSAADGFVRTMFAENTPAPFIDWIAKDMSSAPPHVGLSAMENTLGLYLDGGAMRLYESVSVPIRALNADLWPTDVEANRRHMVSFELTVMQHAGHFIMLERPDEFNRKLSRIIHELSK